jgi:hypothetical protein
MSMRTLILSAVLIIPLFLFNIACEKEHPTSEEVAVVPSAEEKPVHAEAVYDEDAQGGHEDLGYGADEDEGGYGDIRYEDEGEGPHVAPGHESEADTGYESEAEAGYESEGEAGDESEAVVEEAEGRGHESEDEGEAEDTDYGSDVEEDQPEE